MEPFPSLYFRMSFALNSPRFIDIPGIIVMINPLTRMPGLAIKRSILLFTDTKLIWP